MFFARLRELVRPLSVRLTLWHSLIFLGSALVWLVLAYVLLSKRAAATDRESIDLRFTEYVSEYEHGGAEAVRRLAAQRKGRAQKAFFVRLADGRNVTVFQRDPEDWAEFDLAALSRRPLPAPGLREWRRLPSALGTELLLAAQRLPDGALLQVGKANEELRDLLQDFRQSFLLVVLVSLPASFAGGAFLASRALRPVGLLTKAAQEIVETSRFDARVPAPGTGDELDALVQVFNRMLARIAVLVRELRDSIDNVAHDLRTPLTRLRHVAQNALERSSTPATCAHCQVQLDALADCVDEADRVSAMLDTIMDIAEAQAGLVKLTLTPLAVGELAARTVETYAELAEESGVEVRCEMAEGTRVLADELALGRVLANVLDNAIKYTPAGGTVTLSAQREEGRVAIRVADTGVGIPPEDLPRIWERLFRSDRSRSQRGLGLGLSFVRAIVDAHGGTVAATSRPEVGTVIEITLPGG